MQHFVVMVPKTMQFEAGPGAHFDSMNDPQQADAIVQVAAETKPGQPLSFKISGTGMLAANTAPEGSSNGGAMGAGQGGGQGQQGNSRVGDGPGGGIGPPIDAPDPLQKYRWWIIGGFVLALFGGAYYVNTRQRVGFAGGSNGRPRLRSRACPAARAYRASAPPVSRPAVPAAAAPRQTLGMPAGKADLKEELFQLEVEHKHGRRSRSRNTRRPKPRSTARSNEPSSAKPSRCEGQILGFRSWVLGAGS